MSARAELSSVATSLEELLARVTRIADGLSGDDRDLVGPDLFEVERALRSARRRLSSVQERTWGDKRRRG
jgi:hypothetical protein